MKLKQFLTDHREKMQLIYGIFLIVLIPLLIAYNAITIIGRYNDNMDTTLQRETLSEGRSIYAFLQDYLDDTDMIQRKIEDLQDKNSAFEGIEVLMPEDGGYKIVASSEKDNIGKISKFYFYDIAWKQPDKDGLTTDSLKLSMDTDTEMTQATDAEERVWIVAMPMRDRNDTLKAILSVKVSSKIIDDLTSESQRESFIVLIITIIITIFFLLVTVKIWDYVLLYDKIKELDQLKDEFISIASHELRTPLTAIKGYTSIILEGTFGPITDKNMKQSLERVMSSSKKLEDLVEDLLNVSRLEQGRLTVEMTDLQLEPAIEEVVAQLSVTADEKNLKLTFEKPDQPLPLISADKDRLGQVLVNLIGNSIKYTEKGSVTVSTEVKDDEMRIKVNDTGIGISPEAQKRLFQKFYRVQTEKTEKIHGTGLGLWITKQIVELMNGHIYVDSIEGQGTQFMVTLKLSTMKKA